MHLVQKVVLGNLQCSFQAMCLMADDSLILWLQKKIKPLKSKGDYTEFQKIIFFLLRIFFYSYEICKTRNLKMAIWKTETQSRNQSYRTRCLQTRCSPIKWRWTDDHHSDTISNVVKVTINLSSVTIASTLKLSGYYCQQMIVIIVRIVNAPQQDHQSSLISRIIL